MEDPEGLYALLGVPPTATDDEIRRGYLRSVRAAHPDAGGSQGLFVAVQRAWEVLGDSDRRADYDRPPEPVPEPEPEPDPVDDWQVVDDPWLAGPPPDFDEGPSDEPDWLDAPPLRRRMTANIVCVVLLLVGGFVTLRLIGAWEAARLHRAPAPGDMTILLGVLTRLLIGGAVTLVVGFSARLWIRARGPRHW